MKNNKTRYICDFEGCRHRNEENVCCLFNQENCVYYRTLQALNGYKENAKWCDDCKKIKELEAEKDKAWWEGFDTCKAKAGEANVKLSDEIILLKAQIEKMSEILLDLLWFEEHLDPYMYDCNDAQKGELLEPFDNARLFLEKYKCKKCKGKGIIKVGYNGWTTNPCPACEGNGYILRR